MKKTIQYQLVKFIMHHIKSLESGELSTTATEWTVEHIIELCDELKKSLRSKYTPQ